MQEKIKHLLHFPKQALAFVQRTMESAFKAIGAKDMRALIVFIKMLLQSPTGKERVIILEINTLPGMTPATCIFHQAAEVGIKPMDFIDLIVTLGFEEHTAVKNAEAHGLVTQVTDKLRPPIETEK